MHQPEQRLTDYKAQKAAREAPVLALLSTVAVGAISSIAAATIAVRTIIGQYVPNFFAGYTPLHLGTMPLYTPWAIYKAYTAYYQYPMIQHVAAVTAGVTVAATLGMGVYQFMRTGKIMKSVYESDLHGSAHWATEKEVRDMALLSDPKKPASRRTCYVGGYPDKRKRLRYLQHAGAEHIIAFAPTRSGKGVGLVLPTLLGGWQESVVVHDIKGENYLLTADYRKKKKIGQRVLKFNPGFGLGFLGWSARHGVPFAFVML